MHCHIAFLGALINRRVLAAAIVLGVSCWLNAGWTQTAILGEARTMSSSAASTGGLVEALSDHVRELSAKIGERSVLRGDGLDRAKGVVRGKRTGQHNPIIGRFQAAS